MLDYHNKKSKCLALLRKNYLQLPGRLCRTWWFRVMRRHCGASEAFSRGKKKREEDYEAEKDRLYHQVGKLQVELDWLKKKTGHLD